MGGGGNGGTEFLWLHLSCEIQTKKNLDEGYSYRQGLMIYRCK